MVVHRTAGTDKPISLGVWLYIGLLVRTNLFLRGGVIVHTVAGTDKPISQRVWLFGCRNMAAGTDAYNYFLILHGALLNRRLLADSSIFLVPQVA